MSDVGHIFGNDLQVGASGDLAAVRGTEFSTQRVLRRLLTPVGGYIFHPEYGAGLPQDIGEPLTEIKLTEIRAKILSNILLETSVAQNPPPQITLRPIPNGLFCQIDYIVSDTRQPASVSFSLEP